MKVSAYYKKLKKMYTKVILLLNFIAQSYCLKYTGVNEAGLEFGVGVNGPHTQGFPGKLGQNYFAPNPAAIAYTAKKFANIFRLPFSWERMQPTLNGALNADYLGVVDKSVQDILSTGSTVILDVHNCKCLLFKYT